MAMATAEDLKGMVKRIFTEEEQAEMYNLLSLREVDQVKERLLLRIDHLSEAGELSDTRAAEYCKTLGLSQEEARVFRQRNVKPTFTVPAIGPN